MCWISKAAFSYTHILGLVKISSRPHSSSSCCLFSLLILPSWCHPWNTVIPSCLSNFLPGTRTQSPISKITLCPWLLHIYLQTWPLSNVTATLSTVFWTPATQRSTSPCVSAKMASPVTYHEVACYVRPGHVSGPHPALSMSSHWNANQPSALNSNDPSSSVFPHHPTQHHSAEFLLC